MRYQWFERGAVIDFLGRQSQFEDNPIRCNTDTATSAKGLEQGHLVGRLHRINSISIPLYRLSFDEGNAYMRHYDC